MAEISFHRIKMLRNIEPCKASTTYALTIGMGKNISVDMTSLRNLSVLGALVMDQLPIPV